MALQIWNSFTWTLTHSILKLIQLEDLKLLNTELLISHYTAVGAFLFSSSNEVPQLYGEMKNFGLCLLLFACNNIVNDLWLRIESCSIPLVINCLKKFMLCWKANRTVYMSNQVFSSLEIAWGKWKVLRICIKLRKTFQRLWQENRKKGG